jgi:hypothetical protein
VHRALARTRFVEARSLLAGGDEAGAKLARAEAWKARAGADRLSGTARGLCLAGAFLRGVPLAVLESTRKRAPAPTAKMVLAALSSAGHDLDVGPLDAACQAWIDAGVLPLVVAPADPALAEVA